MLGLLHAIKITATAFCFCILIFASRTFASEMERDASYLQYLAQNLSKYHICYLLDSINSGETNKTYTDVYIRMKEKLTREVEIHVAKY